MRLPNHSIQRTGSSRFSQVPMATSLAAARGQGSAALALLTMNNFG
jgi:hypothetical protein